MSDPADARDNRAPTPRPMALPKAIAICVGLVALLVGGAEAAKAIWRAPATWELYELAGLAMLYALPTFVAWRRGHHNAGAIAALNVLAGWTVVGWIGALVWALTNRPPQDPAARL
jgi:uncharacterized membrane protein HdeD (DUF308 family)